jgi:hypothetical protein
LTFAQFFMLNEQQITKKEVNRYYLNNKPSTIHLLTAIDIYIYTQEI